MIKKLNTEQSPRPLKRLYGKVRDWAKWLFNTYWDGFRGWMKDLARERSGFQEEDDYMPSYVIDPSNLQLKEYFRKEGIHFDPYQVYAGEEITNLFSIKLHHGGKFTPPPKRMYVGGKVNYVERTRFDVDPVM
ncbi:hypothetical protein Tco_0967225 [Tanacetum coccineum]